MSRIGLATHTWGTHTDADEASVQLAAFTEAGGTLVDISPVYGEGAAQRILADLLGDLVSRDELVLSGSAGVVMHAPGAGVGDSVPAPAAVGPVVDSSRRTLLRQLDRTLLELGTDHLDIWSIAAWDPYTPLDEVAATLDTRCDRPHPVRGARGFAAWQLASLAATRRHDRDQTPYSLLERGTETE